MRERLRYILLTVILFGTEYLIALFGSGYIRGYLGDVLVIPLIYFAARAVFWKKDSIFSAYVLPLLIYVLGWVTELLQYLRLGEILHLKPGSAAAVILGSTADIKDIICYLSGLYLIGIYLLIESRILKNDNGWYPLACFIQWTWGNIQTTGGSIMYLIYLNCPHRYYHGVIRTYWPLQSGLSVGQFIFTPQVTSEDDMSESAREKREWSEKMAVHEFGHTLQSLLLGPLYLIVIGIPSLSWGLLPVFRKLRDNKDIRYTDLFCEKWASDWGEIITKEEALRT